MSFYKLFFISLFYFKYYNFFFLSQNSESLTCEICHQKFVKQTLYRKHMENHAEEKPYRCPKCSASFNVPVILFIV